jgi:hypothetical protein
MGSHRGSWLARCVGIGSLGLAGAAGCGLPLQDSAASVQNSCAADADCGPTGACAAIAGGMCVAKEADLSGLILEVQPRDASDFGAGAAWVIDLADKKITIPKTSFHGEVIHVDHTLPDLVHITDGRIDLSEAPDSDHVACVAREGASFTILAKIEFQRVLAYPGVGGKSYSAETVLHAEGEEAHYSFELALPPGDYDAYITPLAPDTDTCRALLPPPPKIYRTTITADAPFNATLAPPKTLGGTIAVPSDTGTLEGWRLDLLDFFRGRPISTTKTLGASYRDANGVRVVDLDSDASDPQNRVDYSESEGKPLLRLRPPGDQTGPEVYWDLQAVDFPDSDGNVDLVLTDLQMKPIEPPPEYGIKGRVVTKPNPADRDPLGSQAPIVADLTFLSQELTGPAKNNAFYRVHTQSGVDGYFKVTLIPGGYLVAARPSLDDGNAMAIETPKEWPVAPDTDCCGRTIEAPLKAQLVGQASTPLGDSFFGASVVSTPTLPLPGPFLQSARDTDFLPRSASSLVADDGSFAIGLDGGSHDFSIRPPSGSTFPWLLLPSLAVDLALGGRDLGVLTVPYPVVVTGTIKASDGSPVARASVRAWIPLGGDPDAPYVQIGEVTTDADGNYMLPLPPSAVPPRQGR